MGRAKKEEKKSGGGEGAHWIQGAIKHPGGLHKALKVPEGKKIPVQKIDKAMHSPNPKIKKMADLAKTLGKIRAKNK